MGMMTDKQIADRVNEISADNTTSMFDIDVMAMYRFLQEYREKNGLNAGCYPTYEDADAIQFFGGRLYINTKKIDIDFYQRRYSFSPYHTSYNDDGSADFYENAILARQECLMD